MCFVCEIETKRLPESKEAAGVHVGLDSFAATSQGENSRFFRKEEQALARVQRRLCETEKNTKVRAHRRKVVAKVH